MKYEIGDKVFYKDCWCRVACTQGFMMLVEHPQGASANFFMFTEEAIKKHNLNKTYHYLSSNSIKKGVHQIHIE